MTGWLGVGEGKVGPEEPGGLLSFWNIDNLSFLLGFDYSRSEAEVLLVVLVLVSRVVQPGVLKFSDDKAEP